MTKTTLSLLAAVAACACSREPGAPPAPGSVHAPNAKRPPDIVLVTIDSLRADHLGCYGYPKPTSPVIDRLANEGVRFETAISTSSWTLPSHAALFTGLYDSTHGVVRSDLALPSSARTLAEILRDAGYQTAGFYGGPYLHPVFGLAQGFEHYESCMAISAELKPEDALKKVLDRDDESSHSDVTGPRTVAAVERYLASARSDQPLFLFVHLWDVHYDYEPPAEYVQRFDPDYTGDLDARNYAHNKRIHEGMPARDLQHVIALYDGKIAFTDANLGRILDAYSAHRDLDDAVLIVTSDHGEEFFEHRGKGHQRSLFDEVVHVPLIVRWPAELPGRRVVASQVRTVSVLPTLATIAAAKEPLHGPGRDLGPLLRGETRDPVPALCELAVDGIDLAALRTRELKVVDVLRAKQSFGLDLTTDPLERAPLAPQLPAVARALTTLTQEREKARALGRELQLAPRKIVLDSALRDTLHGLGYTGDDEPK